MLKGGVGGKFVQEQRSCAEREIEKEEGSALPWPLPVVFRTPHCMRDQVSEVVWVSQGLLESLSFIMIIMKISTMIIRVLSNIS